MPALACMFYPCPVSASYIYIAFPPLSAHSFMSSSFDRVYDHLNSSDSSLHLGIPDLIDCVQWSPVAHDVVDTLCYNSALEDEAVLAELDARVTPHAVKDTPRMCLACALCSSAPFNTTIIQIRPQTSRTVCLFLCPHRLLHCSHVVRRCHGGPTS